jgi:hypothetical protein
MLVKIESRTVTVTQSKVTVDLQGCLPENFSYSRRFQQGHRKVYIIVKLIKSKIRKNNYIKDLFDWLARASLQTQTDNVC